MWYSKRWSQAAPWLIPLLYAGGAIAAGLNFPRIENRIFPHLVSELSPATATSIYSAVASGMMALTGIVFSLAFVMVQFSATAYSPRLVLALARDRLMSHALGIFTATFLYAIAALSGVDRNGSGRVPFLSTAAVVALLLASVGMFISLIQRVGLLQVSRMLVFTGDLGRKAIATMYGSQGAAVIAAAVRPLRGPSRPQLLVHRGQLRVIQAIDVTGLVGMASASGGTIEMGAAIGDTLMDGMPLLQIFAAHHAIDERALRRRIVLGEQRAFEQDPKYAIRVLVDIAIKALSPAVNDPTTAVQALDQIEDLLLRLGRCSPLEIGIFRGSDGEVRLVAPFPTWEDFLLLALDEICSYGAGSVQVMRRMNAIIADLISLLPEKRHAALRGWETRLKATIERSFADAKEKSDASIQDRQGLGLSHRHQRPLTVQPGNLTDAEPTSGRLAG
jgi:uncharacterized membrane protein